MKRVKNTKTRNFILFLMCLAFVSAILLPSPGLATSTTFGLADVTWDYLTFTYTDVSGTPLGDVSWLDPADPTVDTRNSFGSAQVSLNGVVADVGDSGAVEGAWVVAGLSTGLSDATGTVGASGQTQPTGGITRGAVSANSNISLNSLGSADVLTNQAAFTGQFTVPTDGFLSITAPYSLQLTASTTAVGEFAYVDALVGLFLSDFGAGAEIGSDFRFPFLFVQDGVSDNYSGNGTLSLLNIPLFQNIQYGFEVSASTVASAAAVPEPATMLLLGSGLLGLGAFRKRVRI